jgi:CBS domain-containing protein
MKKVKDFMIKNVVFFKPNDSIFHVAKVFSEKNISGAPVVENNKVIGIISDSDIVRFMSLNFNAKTLLINKPSLLLIFMNLLKIGKNGITFRDELDRISKTKVKHIMSKSVISVSPDTNIYEAASLMVKYDANRLPVVENGKLIGIIARWDLIKALTE